ncbi:Afadin and alpha-actinin-binding-domain-containing protein, partial [Hysterangium stoloniferum]
PFNVAQLAMDISVSGISFSFQPSELYEQTSTLQYVNSQLVAHGFARSPGLLLDGLPVEEGEKVIKCLMGMLSQRIEDAKRTEELGSKLRKLMYENDRLQSMHRTAVETGANAEREMNLHKSKLVAVQKQHTSEITAHKQTSSELQKTRTALQYLRSTTQNELKRKDKEVERMLERWSKVADSQMKLSGINSGLHCANYAAATEELVRGKGIMEEALEQAEEARGELVKENEGFRSVIFGTAKVLQNITYDVKSRGADGHVEEPSHLTPTAVFAPPTSSLSHPDNAHTKLRELFSALRDAVSTLPSQEDPRTSSKPQTSGEDVAKLKEIITSLHTELGQLREASATASTEAQKVFDRYTKDASERLRATRHATADLSIELIGQPEQDELRNALESRTKELEVERARFTEATVKLGREKAALEEERMKLVEEKRRWAVEQMLAELPPTPGPDLDLVSTAQTTSPSKPTKAKLKPSSPHRVRGSKGGLRSPKKSGNVESVSVHHSIKRVKMRRETKLFETVDVLYDPEDQSPATKPRTSFPLVLPTTFTLPPSSPASSLSLQPLPIASSSLSSMSLSSAQAPAPAEVPAQAPAAQQAPAQAVASTQPSSSSNSATSSSPSPTSSFDKIPLMPRRLFPSPRTPRAAFNGHTKKHAYSPAKPSPLSRILMIADSPPSPAVE